MAKSGDAAERGKFSMMQMPCPLSSGLPMLHYLKDHQISCEVERKEAQDGSRVSHQARNAGVVPRERKAMPACFWSGQAKSFKAYLTALSPSVISIDKKKRRRRKEQPFPEWIWVSEFKDAEQNLNIDLLLALKPYYSLLRVVHSLIL